MKTIHIILNSHIDPIWLWPWQAGLDSALATCRSACDRLDAHPKIFFNRGEAWIYEHIELVDPPLFKRIKKHVDSGRWSIVGGWWIQPDCNLPLGFAMRKQIELGKKYFLKKFGQFPKTAYNVDSFGHAASLPGLMREFGQSRYVMMRPMENEHSLPSRLFRWRGYADGPEVTTFRIAVGYTTAKPDAAEHVLASTTQLPAGIDHTMCFIGVGDHGGGPTEAQIDYLENHRDAFDGWRLEFSTVDRFFEAIKPQIKSLPLVPGDLQHHAVGCYTVHRAVKTAVRRAEHLLSQAQVAVKMGPRPHAGTAGLLDIAWRDLCFHHFHDTLGGTCIHSAYQQVADQLGRASSIADDLIHLTFRRQIAKLKPDPLQRMALFNASDQPFDAFVTLSPWLEGRNMTPSTRVLDEDGKSIDYQLVASEPLVEHSLQGAMLMRATLAPKEVRVFRIDPSGATAARLSPRDASVNGTAIRSGPDVSCNGSLGFPVGKLAMPQLQLFDDLTDTWSHDMSRYSDKPVKLAKFAAPTVTARGPIMAAKVIEGEIGSSRLRAEWRVHRADPFIELRLTVVFVGRHKMLKLVLPLPAQSQRRTDGIMDGEFARPNDGLERPLRDWTRIDLPGGKQIGVVAPDCFALDCNATALRLSLVRSPLMAHHVPHKPAPWRGMHADQGTHDFRFWFLLANKIESPLLESRALSAHRPPIFADLTTGMPTTKRKRNLGSA